MYASLCGLIYGVVWGGIHVMSGPDHLAAVAPIAVDRPRRSWVPGLCWGLGHSGGVWLLALVALALREMLPLEWLSSWGERLVGVVLIGVGIWGLRKAFANRVHVHRHEHDGDPHAHVHLHDGEEPHHHANAHTHTHGAAAIGLLHGLAGTSHVLGVLPALLLPSRFAAFIYVLGFGLGSILAMTAFSWLVGALATRYGGMREHASRWVLVGCSAAAIGIGILWIYRTSLAAPAGAHL